MHWSFYNVFFNNFPAKTKPQVIIPVHQRVGGRRLNVTRQETRESSWSWSLQCLNMMSIQIATFPPDTGHFWFYLESFSRLLYHNLKTIKVCIGRTLLTHTPRPAQHNEALIVVEFKINNLRHRTCLETLEGRGWGQNNILANCARYWLCSHQGSSDYFTGKSTTAMSDIWVTNIGDCNHFNCQWKWWSTVDGRRSNDFTLIPAVNLHAEECWFCTTCIAIWIPYISPNIYISLNKFSKCASLRCHVKCIHGKERGESEIDFSVFICSLSTVAECFAAVWRRETCGSSRLTYSSDFS